MYVKVAMKRIAPKRGRPRIHNNPVWFGMKISLEERELIKKFAKDQGKSASRAIMEMVAESIGGIEKPKSRLSIREILKLSSSQRNKLLHAEAKKAEWIYKNDRDLIMSQNDDILEY